MEHQTPFSRRTLGRLAGATALTGTAAATTAGTASARPGNSTTFRVASFNIFSGLSNAKFKEDFVEIMGRADLVGLQEVHGRGDIINQWASNHGFYAWTPANTWAREVTVLAKKSMFERIDRGTQFVCDSGEEGKPPPPRYITWAKYVHKPSGRKITHINNHLNAHIEANQEGSPGHPTNIPRTDDAEKHIRMIKAMVLDQKNNGQVVVTGDFNVDYVADKRVQYSRFPYTVLENRQNGVPSLRSSYSRIGVTGLPTLGKRHVDYVYAWIRTPEARLMDFDDHHYIYDSKHSDHNAIVARLWMKN